MTGSSPWELAFKRWAIAVSAMHKPGVGPLFLVCVCVRVKKNAHVMQDHPDIICVFEKNPRSTPMIRNVGISKKRGYPQFITSTQMTEICIYIYNLEWWKGWEVSRTLAAFSGGFYLLGYGAFYQTLLDLPQAPQRGPGARGSLPSMLRDSWEKALTEHMDSGMHPFFS